MNIRALCAVTVGVMGLLGIPACRAQVRDAQPPRSLPPAPAFTIQYDPTHNLLHLHFHTDFTARIEIHLNDEVIVMPIGFEQTGQREASQVLGMNGTFTVTLGPKLAPSYLVRVTVISAQGQRFEFPAQAIARASSGPPVPFSINNADAHFEPGRGVVQVLFSLSAPVGHTITWARVNIPELGTQIFQTAIGTDQLRNPVVSIALYPSQYDRIAGRAVSTVIETNIGTATAQVIYTPMQ